MEKHFEFFAAVQVRYPETDMHGHILYGRCFTRLNVWLLEYLKAVGYLYNDFPNEGTDFFVSRQIAGMRGVHFSMAPCTPTQSQTIQGTPASPSNPPSVRKQPPHRLPSGALLRLLPSTGEPAARSRGSNASGKKSPIFKERVSSRGTCS